ncbi:MAG: hypothetical protein Q7T91_01345 [Sulfuricurvum sp.]|nr:hypothetical protein [Sulfuricurvum sp.]
MINTIVPLGLDNNTLENNVALIESYDFPLVSGIDSLYYFIQSNSAYEAFFHFSIYSIVEQAKELNGGFIPKGSLKIKISDIEFVYYDKARGFYFFGDTGGMFRIGFKDPKTNLNVQDISVQLQSKGIYTIGLIDLCGFINKCLLGKITQPFYYVTRVDLNIFCQYDLGNVIQPEHFVTRKRKFGQIIGTKKRYETLYIGKPPARLRVYDKALELIKNMDKFYLMREYLATFDIKAIDPLWNLEFECHRDFLKQYQISTLDDLFPNVEMLFSKCMKQVRLVDISTISEKDFEANRLSKASTHPLWEYLASSYKFNALQQNKSHLERIVYAPKELTSNDFIEDFRALVHKYTEHAVTVNQDDIRAVLHESRLWLTHKAKQAVKPFIPVVLQTSGRNYLLTRNFIAVVTLPKSLEHLSDDDLIELSDLLTKALHQELAQKDQDIGLIIKHTQILNAEKERRRAGQKELELWQQ